MYIQAAARDARKERRPLATSGTMHLSPSWGGRGQGRAVSLLCMCRDNTPSLRATPPAVAPIATDACKSATTRWMATQMDRETTPGGSYGDVAATAARRIGDPSMLGENVNFDRLSYHDLIDYNVNI